MKIKSLPWKIMALVLALMASAGIADADSSDRFVQDRFAIGFFCDPPPGSDYAMRFAEIAEANFTVAIVEISQQSGEEIPLLDDSPEMEGTQISLDAGEGRLFLLPHDEMPGAPPVSSLQQSVHTHNTGGQEHLSGVIEGEAEVSIPRSGRHKTLPGYKNI